MGECVTRLLVSSKLRDASLVTLWQFSDGAAIFALFSVEGVMLSLLAVQNLLAFNYKVCVPRSSLSQGQKCSPLKLSEVAI